MKTNQKTKAGTPQPRSNESSIQNPVGIQKGKGEEIREAVLERKQYLESMSDELAARLRKAPEGTLRIAKGAGKYPEYYHRAEPSMRSGLYIPAKEKELPMKLAQKDYDGKVLKAAEEELSAIEAFLRHLPKESAEEIYQSLTEVRRKLVKPIVETDEEYAAKWSSIEYVGKSFSEDTPELFTDRGERVRSKSEMLIANTLARKKIPYRYEYPVRLAGFGVVHPDFTALNIRLRKMFYWEHLGKLDDEGYVNWNIGKMNAYIKNGIYPGVSLILTWETSSAPIDMRIVQMMIKKYLV